MAACVSAVAMAVAAVAFWPRADHEPASGCARDRRNPGGFVDIPGDGFTMELGRDTLFVEPSASGRHRHLVRIGR
jgi:hypothetical protein